MEQLVAELADLYRLAAAASVDEFPEAVLSRLRGWIEFDGAVFGFGEAEAPSLRIGTAIVHQRDPAILEEYAQVSHADPVTAAFLRRPPRPIVVDSRAIYAGPEHRQLVDFVARHELRHLLLFGDQLRREGPLRWVVLYRAKDEPFDAETSKRLWVIWQHVSCSLDLNRAEALHREAAQRTSGSLALVDSHGTIEAAGHGFRAALRTEWPQFDSARLPEPVRTAMGAQERFLGRSIEVSFHRLGSHVVCDARARGPWAVLSPRERQVAEHFAAGKSYKDIAQLLSVSPHTVRAQLSQVYRKLGVTDKAMLARRLPRDDG
jgi:DNA-binding CsgD family transcriptional regulator